MVLNDKAKEEFEIILELILQLDADNKTKVGRISYENYLTDRLKKEG